jgi:hypothetical protein
MATDRTSPSGPKVTVTDPHGTSTVIRNAPAGPNLVKGPTDTGAGTLVNTAGKVPRKSCSGPTKAVPWMAP